MEINWFTNEVTVRQNAFRQLKGRYVDLKRKRGQFEFYAATSILFRIARTALQILSFNHFDLRAHIMDKYRKKIAAVKEIKTTAKQQLTTHKLAHPKLLEQYLNQKTKEIRRSQEQDLSTLPGYIKHSLAVFEQDNLLSNEKLQTYTQVLRYFELYRDTHRVFSHSTPMGMAVVYMVFKQLLLKIDHRKHLSNFKVVRHPNRLKGTTELSVGQWKAKMTKEQGCGDWTFGTELISVSAAPTSTSPSESALGRFRTSHSLPTDAQLSELQRALDSYLRLGEKTKQEFLNIITGILRDPKIQKAKALLTFCVPQRITHQVGYRAHPLGFTCTCYVDDEATLDNLQNKGYLPRRNCGKYETTTQYRLVAQQLDRPGIKIFSSYHLDHAYISTIKTKIANAVDQLVS